MGLSPSKRVENVLRNSPSFQAAVVRSYEECIDLAQHAFPGLRFYQLLDASSRVYTIFSDQEDNAASKFKQKWITESPTQLIVDETLRKENLLDGGKTSLNLEEFQVFALALFRDMALSKACKTMVWCIPGGVVAILCAHLTAKRLPVIGPKYRTLGPVLPRITVGYAVGATATVYFNLAG